MKTVLLIEDQRAQSLVIERMLKNACQDFDVTRVGRLDDATDALAKKTFDLIVVDLGLPDSSGHHTFATVHMVASRTPIIVLTVTDDEDTRKRCEDGGCFSYLVKGQFSNAEFATLVCMVIGTSITERKGDAVVRETHKTEIEVHGPGSIWARLSGFKMETLLVLAIVSIGIWILHEQANANAKLFLAQHAISQSLMKELIKNQNDTLTAMKAGQEKAEASIRTMIYVISQDEKSRKALNIQMPDELKYGYYNRNK